MRRPTPKALNQKLFTIKKAKSRQNSIIINMRMATCKVNRFIKI